MITDVIFERAVGLGAALDCLQRIGLPHMARYSTTCSTTPPRPSFAFYDTCEEIDRMVAVTRRLPRA